MLLSLPLFAAGAFLAFSLYLFTSYLFKPTKLPLPPGPKPLPLIGNLHQVPKSLQWFSFYQWAKTSFGPVMYMSMGGQPMIILSTVQAAQDLLNRRSITYSDRPRMVMAGELVTKNMHMLLRPYDASYRLHQRMEAPLLNARSSATYQCLQELESRQMLMDLLAESKKKQGKGGGVDWVHNVERTVASITYSLIYGFRLVTGNEEALLQGKKVQAEFARTGEVGAYLVDSIPVLNHLPRCLAPWKKEAEGLYELERNMHMGNMERGRKSPGWNFTKQMLKSSEARDMSPEEIAFDLGILADAGLDTSTVGLSWFMIAWIVHGKNSSNNWVAKAQRLLDEVVGRDRLPEFEDRPQLEYIDAIVNETLRWRPVVVGGVPHATKTEDTYHGHRIPAGSIVLPNAFAITRDESEFGPRPDEFLPERWFDDYFPRGSGGGASSSLNGYNNNNNNYSDNEKEAVSAAVEEEEKRNSKPAKLRDLPQVGFGWGRRICTGRVIAKNSLFIVIARALWAFDVEGAVEDGDGDGEGKGEGKEVKIDDMDCTEGFVTSPKPFRCKLRGRGAWVDELLGGMPSTHEGVDLAEMLDGVAERRTIRVDKM